MITFLARGVGNLKKNFPEIQMPGGLPGGMLKLRFDWYITRHDDVTQKKMRCREFVSEHYLFREAKTVSFKVQILSKEKYSSIFSRQMEAIVFVFRDTFPAVLKIGEYQSVIPHYSAT